MPGQTEQQFRVDIAECCGSNNNAKNREKKWKNRNNLMREHVFCVLNISNGNGCMDDRSTIALLLVGHDSLEHADNQFIVYRDDGLMGERQSTKGRV